MECPDGGGSVVGFHSKYVTVSIIWKDEAGGDDTDIRIFL